MMPFRLVFPEVAAAETRTAITDDSLPDDLTAVLSPDEYGFDEYYCEEKKCGCRRVVFYVYARHAGKHVATINHAFDPLPPRSRMSAQSFLDPLLPQTELSPMLLNLFINVIITDLSYYEHLRTHYRMFKSIVANPLHSVHRKLRQGM